MLADDPKGRFDIRSVPGQIFWFWIAALAVLLLTGGVARAPQPMHNVGVPLRDIIAGYLLWGPGAKRRDW